MARKEIKISVCVHIPIYTRKAFIKLFFTYKQEKKRHSESREKNSKNGNPPLQTLLRTPALTLPWSGWEFLQPVSKPVYPVRWYE